MSKKSRIKTSFSPAQWKRMDKAVAKLGKASVQSYIISQLHDIDILCSEKELIIPCEACKEQRVFGLTPSSLEIIDRIRQKTGIQDASTIVVRFIINPLLLKD